VFKIFSSVAHDLKPAMGAHKRRWP